MSYEGFPVQKKDDIELPSIKKSPYKKQTVAKLKYNFEPPSSNLTSASDSQFYLVKRR